MSKATAVDSLLFAGGPLRGLGLVRGGEPRIMRRALLIVLIGWVPLLLLSAVHGDLLRPDRANSFVFDFGVHMRFLLAAPLLILAESICVPRLAAIAREFSDTGLVADADRARFDSAVTSSRRLMSSRIAGIALVVLAYLLVFAVVQTTPQATVPQWHGTVDPVVISPAGWWGLLISLPLLLLLLLGWLWRIGVWTRFLWRMNRLPLRLDPGHPDHAAGLGFVGSSVEGLLPIGFIVGLLAAGPVVNQVVNHHVHPLQFRPIAIAAILISIVLCSGPLLVFVRRLIEERHRGVLQYGALAMHMSERFEPRWLQPRPHPLQGTLDMSEFTGTNALYSIAANARAVRILPVELRSVWLLSLATFLPFIPPWLVAVPFGELARKIGETLL